MFFCKPRISEGVQMLVQSMVDNPEDWRQGPYHFVNVKHQDIRIWTANGYGWIKLEGNECLTHAEKRHIANGIKKSIALRLQSKD